MEVVDHREEGKGSKHAALWGTALDSDSLSRHATDDNTRLLTDLQLHRVGNCAKGFLEARMQQYQAQQRDLMPTRREMPPSRMLAASKACERAAEAMVRAWYIINEVRATRTRRRRRRRRRRDCHAPGAAVVGAGSVAKQARRISGQEKVGGELNASVKS